MAIGFRRIFSGSNQEQPQDIDSFEEGDQASGVQLQAQRADRFERILQFVGKGGYPLKTSSRCRPFDGVGRIPPGLARACLTQRPQVDRHLVGEQLQNFALECGIPEREAGEVGAVDRLPGKLVSGVGRGPGASSPR